MQLQNVSETSEILRIKKMSYHSLSAKILAVGNNGGFYGQNNNGLGHNRAELLDTLSNKWQRVENYPFDKEISQFSMIFHYNLGFVLFGGHAGKSQSVKTVARFDEQTNEWTKIGNLGLSSSLLMIKFEN